MRDTKKIIILEREILDLIYKVRELEEKNEELQTTIEFLQMEVEL